jgi:peptidoglycan/LPS O-acetylase OafA/YrhL
MIVANALISTLHHSKHAASVGEVVTHLLLIHTFFVQYLGGLDAPYWTLAVEAQFYVIMPLIANALIRLSPSKLQRRARFLRATIVGTIVVSLVWRIATALYIPLVDPNLTFVWYRNIIGMAMCFALGATVAIFESDGIVLSHRTAVTCTVGGLVLLGTMIPIGIFCRDVRLEKLAFDVLGSVSASAILLGSLHVRWDRFTKLAVPSFVSIIAAHSYALYLTHFPLLSLLRTGLTSLVHGGVRLELAIIGSFLLSAPLLAAAYRRFVEKPFLRVKQRIPEARPLGSDTANALVPSLSPF